MEFTGERVVPGQVDADLWNEHIARYAFAARWAQLLLDTRAAGRHGRLRILDAACGSGYGSAYLAEASPAVEVVGVDISEEAVAYARAHYHAANLRFERGDCASLAFGAGSFDLVVAFEIIEHLADPGPFLLHAARLLAVSGRLIASTPNRRFYSEERRYSNPFHAREYDAEEFAALLKPCFPESVLFFQNHIPAISFFPVTDGVAEPVVSGADRGSALRFGVTPGKQDQAHFVLGVCGRQKPPGVAPFVFLPDSGNVLREREQHIRSLEKEVLHLTAAVEERQVSIAELEREREAARETLERQQRELDERARWAATMQGENERMGGIIQELQRELDERARWAAEMQGENERLGSIIQELQKELDEKIAWARALEADVAGAREALAGLQREFDDRTAWALRLDAELQAARGQLDLIFASRWYRWGQKANVVPVRPPDKAPGGGQ